MSGQDTIAVIGAGVIGTAVTHALAREGRKVVLIDRAAPGVAGASFGNAGHIATELVQPLPAPGLLFGFWRQLFRFGGALDLPPAQIVHMAPWIRRFASSAFRQAENTVHLAPLVLPAAAAWSRWLEEIGRSELLRRHGHYEIGLGRGGRALMDAQALAITRLGIRVESVPVERLLPLQGAAGAGSISGLWFEDSAHVVDPLRVVQALAVAAMARNVTLRQDEVRALRPLGDRIEVLGDHGTLTVEAAVVCTGMGSQPLLASFGLHCPLQAVRGYHVEIQGHAPFLDAPVVYTQKHIVVTPMAGRLRASSYMEFAADRAPPDPRKPARLRRLLRELGYDCEPEGSNWVGARPVLPDYLPGIGRAPGPSKLFYAVGHQHIGVTLAPITAELVTDLVAERAARLPVAAFDLRRFGAS